MDNWLRNLGNQSTSVQNSLASQWTNPVDILSVLMIIGGDVVQRAFAQGTGKLYVPVCFSFGCVAYAFMGWVNIISHGRLLPPPDYECKVFNLGSGYGRESKSFIVGRLLRDLEAHETRQLSESDRDYAIKITVFEAVYNSNGCSRFSWTKLHLVGLGVTALQIGISMIPYGVNQDWNILLIVLIGTFLVQWAGALPQWTAEKLPHRQNSRSIYALTGGNGSRDVMVIFGYGNCLDLESLACPQTPQNSRPWEKFKRRLPLSSKDIESAGRNDTWRSQPLARRFWPLGKSPLGFAITKISYGCLSVLWLLLLINVSAAKAFPDSWCLLSVGGIGMFQNAWLASKELSPRMRNIPLRKKEHIVARKVMDGIMDFHRTYDCGVALRDEFFPGKLRDDEDDWWAGNYADYDNKRALVPSRGQPRYRDEPRKYERYIYPTPSSSST
ncbi:hypothetical protein PFICI_13219 [Pestalotiopsis fici W106-1]|uniref:Uncharacterized protein n=1 Tax=Pestalotiopsis fici (strain W106-1 / CGMCC3.15140) TaxID=1229662 RepID=W3WLH0_PESFW|nr:uncharacterized protein PFICI_13219 [Pestalotiopsis fici W106-1]ETS74735.1 hypothetical protein PFICI_13219 [Pestalotiopsis fici W106-1]